MAERRPPRSLLNPCDEEFWEWCGKGELRLQRCQDCDHMPWPAAMSCEKCGGERLEFEPMSGKGKLVSWCTIEQDYYRGALPVPWDTIVVELDEGPFFLSNPNGFRNSEAQHGMAVQVSFIACEDDNGAFNLPVFERV